MKKFAKLTILLFTLFISITCIAADRIFVTSDNKIFVKNNKVYSKAIPVYWTDPYLANEVVFLDFNTTNASGEYLDTGVGNDCRAIPFPSVASGPTRVITGTNQNGEINYGLFFDGIDDYLQLTNSTPASFQGNQSFSLSLFMNIQYQDNTKTIYWIDATEGANDGYNLMQPSWTPNVFLSFLNERVVDSGVATLNYGSFHLYTMVFDNLTDWGRGWKDTTAGAQDYIGTEFLSTPGNVIIGANRNYAALLENTIIDTMVFYSGVMGLTHITNYITNISPTNYIRKATP